MYKIVAGDYIVHMSGSIDKDFTALECKLDHSLNKSGTLTCKVPPNNYAFVNGALKKLQVPVIVYYNDVEIWRGRILDLTQDFNKQVTFKCEGWLSVLCDSIVRPENNIRVALTKKNAVKQLQKLIDNHNAQMEANKHFTLFTKGFPSDETDPDDHKEIPDTDGTSIHELALQVLEGLWGDGDERRERLTAAGYDYEAVQAEVNRIVWSGEYDEYSEANTLLATPGITETDVEAPTVTKTGPTASDIILLAQSYLGLVEGDEKHQEIINTYNSWVPLPRNYRMDLEQPWCDAFVSAIFIMAGGVDLLGGTECYVDSHIAIFTEKGIWTNDTQRVPNPGDLITFNWDGDYETDHIGIVVSVQNNTITTIEGNTSDTVGYQTYEVGDSVIRGYAVPNYGESESGPRAAETNEGYYNTLDYIMDKFVNNEDIGGVIWCEANNLYYYADGNFKEIDNPQSIVFGSNLLDFTNFVDASEVYTCMIPVGKDGLLLNGSRRTPTGDTLYGVDVSGWQDQHTAADWANTGLDFAILRVTERNGKDTMFDINYDGCKNAGMLVGGYKYSYAYSAADSKREAEEVVEALEGRALDLPIFIDLEWEEQEDFGETMIRDIILEFENVVVNAGYKFGIYCNKNWYENIIPEDCRTKYDFWIASIPNPDDGQIHEDLKPNYEDCNLVCWQYSFNGTVPGMTETFDMDILYSDYGNSSRMVYSNSGYGTDYIVNDQGVAIFGRIFRSVEFPEADDVGTLRTLAEAKLQRAIEEATTIEISAFDLSILDVSYGSIALGCRCRITSKPHGIDADYICSGISIDLCNPANNVYTFGAGLKTLTSNYNRLYSSVYNGANVITNYIITDDDSATKKTDITYSIVSKRVEFNAIRFYKLGTTVYLSFVATFKKKVANTSSIMKFSADYAPDIQSVGIAYDETTDKNYTMKATSDGQLVVNNNKEIAVGDVVSGNLTWQYRS